MIFKEPPQKKESRKYIRLNSVFPVRFQILSLDEARSLSGCLQGFTSNIGRGGICLQANNLIPVLTASLENRRTRLSLDIQMPLTGKSVKALARVAWFKHVAGCPNSYLIGLSYEKIDPLQNKRLIHYAWTRKLIVPALAAGLVIFGLGFGLNTFINAKLIKGNITLVEQLVNIVQKSSIAKQKIKKIDKERADLQVKLESLNLQIRAAESPGLLEQLRREKDALQAKVIAIQADETVITEELLQLDKIKTSLEEANLEKMYQWLKAHQNPRTGLVVSLAGSAKDKEIAFTYDQAQSAQGFISLSDFARARRVFSFFKNNSAGAKDGFLSAYYIDGTAVEQALVASGPNISLGIAICQYIHKTKDRQFLGLAEGLAARIVTLQQQDKNGGVPASDGSARYFAKDNIDAYALFSMLSAITGKKEYEAAGAQTLKWLASNIYDKNGVKADMQADIVGDTYAWAITAIGPQGLEALAVNPERIIEFAEIQCKTNGQGQNLAQGQEPGIMVSEWAAQMVLAYKIMADYYYQKGLLAKARSYAKKSGDLMNELDNMIISSQSAYGRGESCLPYYSRDSLSNTCAIKAQRTKSSGCVAGTVYALFAYYQYNPLKFQD